MIEILALWLAVSLYSLLVSCRAWASWAVSWAEQYVVPTPVDTPAGIELVRSGLTKIPKHIGLVFNDTRTTNKDVARVVNWCRQIGIGFVSVYHATGTAFSEGHLCPSPHVSPAPWAFGSCLTHWPLSLPTAEDGATGSEDVATLLDQQDGCRVRLLCADDGRPAVVRCAQRLCAAVARGERNAEEINSDLVDQQLQGKETVLREVFGRPHH